MAKPESYRDFVDRMFGELGDLERQSLLLAIQKLDEAAQSIGIDVVAELEKGHLVGLVHSLTPRPSEENVPWFKRPAILGALVPAMTLLLNLVFW